MNNVYSVIAKRNGEMILCKKNDKSNVSTNAYSHHDYLP